MQLQKWFLELQFQYKLGITVFVSTLSAYLILLILGRVWRARSLSSTIYQMYMSFSWIGNIPASLLIGYLLGFSLSTTAVVCSALTVVALILGSLIQPYEARKASEV